MAGRALQLSPPTITLDLAPSLGISEWGWAGGQRTDGAFQRRCKCSCGTTATRARPSRRFPPTSRSTATSWCGIRCAPYGIPKTRHLFPKPRSDRFMCVGPIQTDDSCPRMRHFEDGPDNSCVGPIQTARQFMCRADSCPQMHAESGRGNPRDARRRVPSPPGLLSLRVGRGGGPSVRDGGGAFGPCAEFTIQGFAPCTASFSP